ncbi:MAG: hypothetical protein ACYSXF_01490 [Planctomycetota bacterium]|jgi:hypothetical protein
MSDPPQHQGYFAAAPGSMPGMIPPAPSVWPTVIGTISIVLGAMGLLCYGCGAIGEVVGQFAARVAPQEGIAPQAQGAFLVYLLSSHCVAFLLSLWLLVVGIGTAQRRPWSRPASIGWAITKVVVGVVDTVLGFVFLREMATHVIESLSQGGSPAPPPPEGVMEVVLAFMIIGWFFFVLIWPVFLLIWFARRRVRAEVAGWRQQDEQFAHMM